MQRVRRATGRSTGSNDEHKPRKNNRPDNEPENAISPQMVDPYQSDHLH